MFWLTKDIQSETFLYSFNVQIPLTHDGACIIDLHRLKYIRL